MAIESGVSRGVLLSTIFASIGALMYGIDAGWFSTSLGLARFNAEFGTLVNVVDGVRTVSLSASEQSAGTSIGQGGIMFGCAVSTPISRYYGRRAAVAVMSLIALIGSVVQITSSIGTHVSYWQLVAGKFIVSCSMGIACNVVPTYQAELAPARWRGSITNLYQTVSIAGVIIATATVYALSDDYTRSAWMVPIGLQFIAPSVLLAGLKWMPESPRWLVWQGRTEEARSVLEYLHGTDHDYSAEEEVNTLVSAYELEKSIRQPALLDVFKGSDRRRTIISVGIQCLQQLQGSSYMTNYVVLFLISLGMTNIFRVVMILYSVYFAAILFSFYLPDRFGRRPMLIWGAFICAIGLFIVSGLNVAVSPSTEISQKVGLAFLFIWYFVFGLVWSPLTWITSTEVCSARVREPTLTLATFSGFGTGLVISLVSPYIQDAQYGNLGGSIGFIWAGFTVISIPFVWFLIPEMKGLSLERIDQLFDQGIATRKFQTVSKQIDADDITSAAQTPSGSFSKELA